jgi:hypothetical protein
MVIDMCRKIGNLIEKYASDTFNLVNAPYNHYYDALLLNIPIEIKGILKHPVDACGRNKNGRVWITNRNHLELVNGNGMYLFVIYDYPKDVYDVQSYEDINVCYTLFIAAHRIKVNTGSNSKISYKKLMELV